MRKSITGTSRRNLLRAGAVASVLAVAPSALRAQPKIAPPNIIKAGTLVMSINPTLPPLQFVDDKGQLQGMRVELANECCKQLGLAPEYIRTEFATMIPGLAAKRWDMINTGIFWTEERSKLMYMVPYEQAAISFLAAKGNPLGLKTIDDLAGKRISVELGGIEERRTREVNDIVTKKGLKPVNVMTFNNFAEAFQALKAGQSDAATCIDATAMYMQQRGDFTRAISGVFPQTACFAFANKPLAEAVVGALDALKKNGFYDKLLDQYGVLKIDEPIFSIKGPGPG
jgi:polar amino acid transport system substrate-binding protein